MRLPDGQKIDLVIFDMDDVLLRRKKARFDRCPTNLFEGLLTKEEEERAGKEIIFKNINWVECFREYGINTEDKERLAEISKRIFRYDRGNVEIYEWVNGILSTLYLKVNLALLTNNTRLSVFFHLKSVLHYFNYNIVTFENAVELKPGKGGVLQLCRRTKTNPENAIMIGDSPEDIAAALKAGAWGVITCWESKKTWINKLRKIRDENNLNRKIKLAMGKPEELIDFFGLDKNT